MSKIDVDPGALEEHASQVTDFMSQISGATADAGNTIDIKAFGIVCVAPAQILQAWIQGADSMIKQAVASGQEVSDALREMAEDYRQNEVAQTGAFDSITSSVQFDLKGTP